MASVFSLVSPFSTSPPVLLFPPQIVVDAERQAGRRDLDEDQRILAQQVRLSGEESRPHADVAADALVRLQPFDAAHPLGGVSGLTVPVGGEVVGQRGADQAGRGSMPLKSLMPFEVQNAQRNDCAYA